MFFALQQPNIWRINFHIHQGRAHLGSQRELINHRLLMGEALFTQSAHGLCQRATSQPPCFPTPFIHCPCVMLEGSRAPLDPGLYSTLDSSCSTSSGVQPTDILSHDTRSPLATPAPRLSLPSTQQVPSRLRAHRAKRLTAPPYLLAMVRFHT